MERRGRPALRCGLGHRSDDERSGAGDSGARGEAIESGGAAFAYVSDQSGDQITPVNLMTGVVGTPIPAGVAPIDIAITPDGSTAYTAGWVFSGGDVTPISLPSGTQGTPIEFAGRMWAVEVTPDGSTAYAASYDETTLTPIDTTTNVAGTPIQVGVRQTGLAIAPDGTTAYVVDQSARAPGKLWPIDLATGVVGTAINIGNSPGAIAISPDSSTALVSDGGNGTVYPVDLTTGQQGAAILTATHPYGPIAFTPDGTTAYVTNQGVSEGDDSPYQVTPIDIATMTAHDRIPVVGTGDIAITANGTYAYVTTGTGITPIDLATDSACTPIDFGGVAASQRIALTPGTAAPTGCHPFDDVPAWVTEAVSWAFGAGYMNGFGDLFKPYANMNRAQVANLLYNVAGAPDLTGLPAHGFGDVPLWVDDAVTWLVGNGHATGYAKDNTFRPLKPITRAAVSRMLFRIAGSPPGSPANTFTDVPDWVDDAVSWITDPANTPPYATGFGTKFKPLDNINRAQTTRMVCRINTPPGTC